MAVLPFLDMKNLVPVFIQRQYRQGRFAGRMLAASMFVDISGFTRMTDTLMQYGKEGIETLLEILAYIFEPTVRSIYACGGFVATYAGDAFTAIFPAEELPQEADHQAAQRAAQRALIAAQEISQFFRERGVYDSLLDQFSFSAKVGLGFGETEWGILGDEASRLFYFRGAAINACAEAEHYAEAGEIWAERAFFDHLAALEYPSRQAQGNFAPLPGFVGAKIDHVDIEAPIFSESEMRLFSGEREYDFPEGEFREVISVFLAFDDMPDFAAFVNTALTLQRRYGGSHPLLDFGDKGSKLVLFFGAPVAYENKEERALQFIAELWRQTPPPARLKAGLTRGVVYAGFYGASLQQNFSALGEVVNQAARFMTRASWGQLLCDAGLSRTPGYNFSYLGDFNYKGRAGPIPTYALLAAYAPGTQPHTVKTPGCSALLIGRENELRSLHACLEPLRKGQFGGVVYVDGEAGLGKTHLLQTFQQETPQFQWFFLPCDEVLRKSLNPLIYFLNEYFGQNDAVSLSEKRQRFELRFDQLFQRTRHPDLKRELKRGRPFLAALLQLEGDESWLGQFDAQARYENSLDALKALFKAESAWQPLILYLDDAHWIDPDSQDFFRYLTRNVEDSPFLLLVACRYLDDGGQFQLSLDAETPVQRLSLAPLSMPEVGQLVACTLGCPSASVPLPTLTFIYRRSGGNPFFVEQVSLYLSENHLLDERNNLDARLISGQAELEIPATINSILVARIDRLTAELKETVKTASVLGQEFATLILSAMLRKVKASPAEALRHFLSAGEERSIWQPLSEMRYIFKHALIRDAVYGMQLKKQLRALHKLAGESIEELFQADLKPYYVDLAEHYEKARLPQKAIAYLTLAAQTAMDAYRNQEAVALYQRLLQYTLPPEAELCALENKGKAEHILGDWEAAKQTFACLLARAEALELPFWQAKAANALAYLLLACGEVECPIALAEQAQRLALQIGSRAEQAQALKNLGHAFNKRGENERARQIHTEMLAVAKESGDASAAAAALFHLRQYLLDEGAPLIAEFEAYLRQAEAQNDLRLMSDLWFYITDVYLLQNDYAAAEQANRRMYRIVQQIGDKRSMCYAIGDRGIVLAELGRFDEASQCFRQKLILARELGDVYNIWEGLFNSGILDAHRKNYAEAAGWLQAAAQTARKYTLTNELVLTLLELADNSLKQGLVEEARRSLAEADALNATLKNDQYTRRSRLLMAKIQHDLPTLDKLLASAQEEERAELYFERWQMTAAEDDRAQARTLYQNLYAQRPCQSYRSRLAILAQ